MVQGHMQKPAKHQWWSFENSFRLKVAYNFHNRAPPQMFDRVLNKSLRLFSKMNIERWILTFFKSKCPETKLGTPQTSKMESLGKSLIIAAEISILDVYASATAILRIYVLFKAILLPYISSWRHITKNKNIISPRFH